VSLTSESSVGSGSRRLEALVGLEALNTLHQERNLIRRLASTLKAPVDEIETRISDSLEDLRVSQRELAALQSKLALSQLPTMLQASKEVSGRAVLAISVQGVSADALKELTSAALAKLGENAVVLLGTVVAGSAVLMCAVGKNAQADIKAGNLVKSASEVLGGGGGGRPDFAQGGGPNSQLLAAALDKAISSL
jgi:alanyl-tRNA synthetase